MASYNQGIRTHGPKCRFYREAKLLHYSIAELGNGRRYWLISFVAPTKLFWKLTGNCAKLCAVWSKLVRKQVAAAPNGILNEVLLEMRLWHIFCRLCCFPSVPFGTMSSRSFCGFASFWVIVDGTNNKQKEPFSWFGWKFGKIIIAYVQQCSMKVLKELVYKKTWIMIKYWRCNDGPLILLHCSYVKVLLRTMRK